MYLEKLLVCNAFIKLHVHVQTVPTFHAVTVVVIPGKLLEQIPLLGAQFSLSKYSTGFFHGKDARLQGLSEQPPQLQSASPTPVLPPHTRAEPGFSIVPCFSDSFLLYLPPGDPACGNRKFPINM